MGIIKKSINTEKLEKTEPPKEEQKKQKILGNIIKTDFLGKELTFFDFPQEKLSKKIIKKTEAPPIINEIVEEMKDTNIVAKSSIEFQLEEEKNKYNQLNEELQQKIQEYNQKVQEIENTKNSIISEAQNQAQIIIQKSIEEAQNKAKQILQEAYEEGFKQGTQQAKKELENVYNQKIQQLENEIKNILNIRSTLIKEFESDLIELSFNIAEKIINKKINEEQSIVVSYLSELLTRVERSKSITIWVNPEELEEVKIYRDKIKSMLEDVENLTIAPDEKIEKGGCIIETNFGKIDSRISSKMEVLKEIILKHQNA